MNYLKRILLSAMLLTTGLYASQQTPIAAVIIKTMQDCINFNQQLQQTQANNTQVAMDENQAQSLFTRLLDQYITHFGQVYEKSTYLGWSTANYIASKENSSVAMTPELYPIFLQVLEDAAKNNWGKNVELQLAVKQQKDLVIIKSFKLNDIIIGVKNVPLPVQYSTAAKIAMGVGAAAVIGTGAYLAYQAYGTQIPTLPEIKKEVDTIDKKLDALPATDDSANSSAENVATPSSVENNQDTSSPAENIENYVASLTNSSEGQNPEILSSDSQNTPAGDDGMSSARQEKSDNNEIAPVATDIESMNRQTESTPSNEFTPDNSATEPQNLKPENAVIDSQDVSAMENNAQAEAEPSKYNKVAIGTGAAIVGTGAFVASKGKAGRAQMAQVAKTYGQKIVESGKNAATSVNKTINPKGHEAMLNAQKASNQVSNLEEQISRQKNKEFLNGIHTKRSIENIKLKKMEGVRLDKLSKEEIELYNRKSPYNYNALKEDLEDVIKTKNKAIQSQQDTIKNIHNLEIQLNQAQKEFNLAEQHVLDTRLNPLTKKVYETSAANKNIIEAENRFKSLETEMQSAQKKIKSNQDSIQYTLKENYDSPKVAEELIRDAKNNIEFQTDRINFLQSDRNKALNNLNEVIAKATTTGYNPAIQKSLEYTAAAAPGLAVAGGIQAYNN